jgi:hypothetical protein
MPLACVKSSFVDAVLRRLISLASDLVARWRNGNAAVCKTAMRGFESLPRLHSPYRSGARDVSLLKILILSNVLDPFVSLEALHDAYRTVDEIERERHRVRHPFDRQDPRDAHVRSVIAAFWN